MRIEIPGNDNPVRPHPESASYVPRLLGVHDDYQIHRWDARTRDRP